MRLCPLSAGLTAMGRAPWRFYLLASITVALGAWLQQWLGRTARRPAPAPAVDWSFAAPTLALTWLALAFALPAEYRGQTLSPRLASASLLGLLWLPRLEPPSTVREQRLAHVAHALFTIAAIGTLGALHFTFARFDRSMRPLDAAMARIPVGSRVATLVYDTKGVGSRLPVYLHIGGYLVAGRGGMASSGFTRTGVTYASTVPRDALLVNQMWMPSTLGWRIDLDRYGAYYDYVLVRTGGRYSGSPFVSARTDRFVAEPMISEGALQLWRIVARPNTNMTSL
jgi:hypothetical protein